MGLKEEIRNHCFRVSTDLVNIYDAHVGTWQEAPQVPESAVGPLSSGEAIIALMEAFHTAKMLDYEEEPVKKFWNSPIARQAWGEATEAIADCNDRETRPYIDFTVPDALGDGFPNKELPHDFDSYTETLYIKAKTGLFARRLKDLELDLQGFNFEIEDLYKSVIISYLSMKVPKALVCNMRDMDGEDVEYGWSFAIWPENVAPCPGEEVPAPMGLLSIPYYTYHVLDTYATALFDKEITDDDVIRFYKKGEMENVLKWLEKTFLKEGKEGAPDITKEEIGLERYGFYNVMTTQMNLFNNAYVLGSWLSAALCLQRVMGWTPDRFSLKERIREGLLFLADQALEPKYSPPFLNLCLKS